MLAIVPQHAHGEDMKNAVENLVNNFFGLVAKELFLLHHHKRIQTFVFRHRRHQHFLWSQMVEFLHVLL